MQTLVDAYDSQELPWPAQTAADLINTLDEDCEGLEGLAMVIEERTERPPSDSAGVLDDMSAEDLVEQVREILDSGQGADHMIRGPWNHSVTVAEAHKCGMSPAEANAAFEAYALDGRDEPASEPSRIGFPAEWLDTPYEPTKAELLPLIKDGLSAGSLTIHEAYEMLGLADAAPHELPPTEVVEADGQIVEVPDDIRELMS